MDEILRKIMEAESRFHAAAAAKQENDSEYQTAIKEYGVAIREGINILIIELKALYKNES